MDGAQPVSTSFITSIIETARISWHLLASDSVEQCRIYTVDSYPVGSSQL